MSKIRVGTSSSSITNYFSIKPKILTISDPPNLQESSASPPSPSTSDIACMHIFLFTTTTSLFVYKKLYDKEKMQFYKMCGF